MAEFYDVVIPLVCVMRLRGRIFAMPVRPSCGPRRRGAAHSNRRQPEEIAPAYVFLASPQTSSYITGEILPIVGGYRGG
jgi:NAD(P)-dependent dehydrogenase (short-subunit alcohol dehydrogenase family)